MKKLNKTELCAVTKAAREYRAKCDLPEKSRVTIFTTLFRKVGHDGLELVTVASRRGEKEIKPIAEFNPATGRIMLHDINWKGIAGWCVDWNVDENTRKGLDYTCSGYFCHQAWKKGDADNWLDWDGVTMALPSDCLARADILARTRYRYCGWKPLAADDPALLATAHWPNYCPNYAKQLAEILYAYAKDPKTELLVKAGLFNAYRFSPVRNPKKCAELTRNKVLMKLLIQNPGLATRYNWNDLVWMSRSGKRTLADVEERERARNAPRVFFSAVRQSRPTEIQIRAAYAYCVKHGIDAGRYCEAMNNAKAEGLDLRARCTAYPTDFAAFYEARAKAERIRHKKQLREWKKQEARMRREEAKRAKREAKLRAIWERTQAERDALIARFVDELRALVEKNAKKLNLGDWQIVWLKSQDEFLNEGNEMGNCIGGGSYSANMAARDCVCLALAREGEGRVDIEIGDGWKVKQCYARKNTTPPADAREVAQRLAALFRKHRKQLEKRLAA